MQTDGDLVRSKAPWAFAVCMTSALLLWVGWCVLIASVGEAYFSPAVHAFASVAIVLVPALIYLRSTGPRPDAMGLRYRWRRGVLVGLLFLALDMTVLAYLTAFDLSLVPTDVDVWLDSIILSPFAEELLFRRVAIDHLSKRHGAGIAILISSLLLVAFYLTWPILSGDNDPVFIVGAGVGLLISELICGVIYRWTRSLWSNLLPSCFGSFADTIIV